MRYVPQVLITVGLIAIVFGWWGLNTVAGRRQFDEMAGMIPLGAGVIGAVALLAGIVWFVVRLRH